MMVLSMSTISFTICFMVWTMFGEIGNPIAEKLGFNSTQFGIMTAIPILTGSLMRLPMGALTDRFGGRPVFFMMLCFGVTLVSIIWMWWTERHQPLLTSNRDIHPIRVV